MVGQEKSSSRGALAGILVVGGVKGFHDIIERV